MKTSYMIITQLSTHESSVKYNVTSQYLTLDNSEQYCRGEKDDFARYPTPIIVSEMRSFL